MPIATLWERYRDRVSGDPADRGPPSRLGSHVVVALLHPRRASLDLRALASSRLRSSPSRSVRRAALPSSKANDRRAAPLLLWPGIVDVLPGLCLHVPQKPLLGTESSPPGKQTPVSQVAGRSRVAALSPLRNARNYSPHFSEPTLEVWQIPPLGRNHLCGRDGSSSSGRCPYFLAWRLLHPVAAEGRSWAAHSCC